MSIVPDSIPQPRVTGAVLALSAFSLAIFIGLFVGNPAIDVLLRGLVAMLASYVVGWGAGFATSCVITNSLLHASTVASRTNVAAARG